MRANNLLQVIFSFFLGLVVVAFVGIGVNTFYPAPASPTITPTDPDGTGKVDAAYTAAWTAYESARNNWQLTTSIILLIAATLIMVVSLIRAERMAVLSNGLLLGGAFTMIYAVGMSASANQSITRFGVVTVALAVTIGVGWIKFAERKKAAAAVAAPSPLEGDFVVRLQQIEHKLDALGRALRD